MISNQHIVCISNTTWHGPFTKSTVQIMSRLAVNNKLLFVEYPFTIKDFLLSILKKRKAPILRILGFKSRIKEIKTEKGSIVYQLIVPPVIPCDFIKNETIFRFIFLVNTRIYLHALKKALKKLHMTDVVSISAYNPYYGLSLKGKLNEKLNIYYSHDGPNIRRHGKRVLKIDAQYSAAADAVITTSDFLARNKISYNSKCFVVKNGVDFETFNKYSRVESLINSHVTIGYIGSMDFRFDIELVETTVKAFPDYAFHFIGNVSNVAVTTRLGKYANVQFLAPVKPEHVPELLSKFNAGIIPYLQNEINKNIYPLKINEYLAVGVPVIMTRFAELPEFEEIVDAVTNSTDFIKQLKYHVENDNNQKRKQRIEFASKNSWDNRSEEFSRIIAGLLHISKNN
jgi:teichuronic acid biosynthesis glycosyltransferase TuaH